MISTILGHHPLGAVLGLVVAATLLLDSPQMRAP